MKPANLLPPTFKALMQSHHVTLQTRAALDARLAHEPVVSPHYFGWQQFQTLTAIGARLIPQHNTEQTVDLPGMLDEQLNSGSGSGKGWRYDVLPPDDKMFRDGIDRVDCVAQALCGNNFIHLNGSQQDEMLRSIQKGEVSEGLWQRIPAQRFFEELLAALCAIYYSHPFAKAAIGDISFADVPGWTAIGLGEQDLQEQRTA